MKDRHSETGTKLADLIKEAIADGKITNDEYDKIMHAADADGHLDPQEKNMIAHLQELIASKTVKRVAE